MVATLQHPEIHADEIKGVEEISETFIECASCNTAITFADDGLLWGLNLTIVLYS